MSTLTKSEAGTPAAAGDAFLSVRDLRVRFRTEDGIVKAVNELNFDLQAGKTLGIVGESGSGKSVSNLAVMGLHNPRNTTIEGSIKLDGQELLTLPQKELERLRGNKMAMIFQDSLAALSPYYTIGRQISEPFMKHTGASKREARTRAIDMLAKVGIPQPDKRVDSYPHEFSGGMRQRAMIAMALVCSPKLLIADEPTTALDVTVQAQIVDLLKELQEESGTSIIFITHDLGVIREIADDVLVMYAGRAVERGTMRQILKTPQHPYGWGLLSSIPRINASVDLPLRPIPGSPPSLLNPPSGCAFNPRCEFRSEVPGDRCTTERPGLDLVDESGHLSACHLTHAQKQSILTEQILPRLSS
ncbi:ABC transporter ATP-binding protein [Kitasatospora sp. NPDC088134]|uniref:ABC transporter ATP-binding protein n=1 Tax=Kitasatospora sp. NPDC088134 TaxID=3364071 RepID=UPI003817B438